MHPAADRIVELYERTAREWDRARREGSRDIERPWLDRFLSPLPRRAEVLDLGCGGGEPIARYLIERGCGLTGIDSAPKMIELCRERFPEHAWSVADMRALQLGRRFDGLVAWDSFFHLPPDQQRAMLPAFRAHANPAAALLFTSGPAHGEAIGSWQGEPLYHASLSPDEYRSLLDASGFDVVRHVANDPDCGGHTVWLARFRQVSATRGDMDAARPA